MTIIIGNSNRFTLRTIYGLIISRFTNKSGMWTIKIAHECLPTPLPGPVDARARKTFQFRANLRAIRQYTIVNLGFLLASAGAQNNRFSGFTTSFGQK